MGILKGKKSDVNLAAINLAQTQYDSSLQIFRDAQDKISKANETLTTTVSDITAKIAELESLRSRALEDKERNCKIQFKLDEFLSV